MWQNKPTCPGIVHTYGRHLEFWKKCLTSDWTDRQTDPQRGAVQNSTRPRVEIQAFSQVGRRFGLALTRWSRST